MKPLIVSLACAVGLSTAGVCGDLGNADISALNNAKAELSFSANCYGPLDEPSGPECKVDFSNGIMRVNGSSGIEPDQIKYIKNGWVSNGYYVTIQYTTSDGETSLGQFSFYEKSVAKQFLSTVIAFKSNKLTSQEDVIVEDTIQPATEIETVIETDAYDYTECNGPTILCFDIQTEEIKSIEKEIITEEKAEEIITEVETNSFDAEKSAEDPGCTGPTILCF